MTGCTPPLIQRNRAVIVTLCVTCSTSFCALLCRGNASRSTRKQYFAKTVPETTPAHSTINRSRMRPFWGPPGRWVGHFFFRWVAVGDFSTLPYSQRGWYICMIRLRKNYASCESLSRREDRLLYIFHWHTWVNHAWSLSQSLFAVPGPVRLVLTK